MSDAALDFRGVSVRHEPGASPTLEDITFSVTQGERVALVGLNGSGKTTLLMSAVGLVPHEGDIHLGGQKLSLRTLARLRQGVGFLFNVPEDQLLFPGVIEDVAFGAFRRGLDAREATARASGALASLGVAELAEAIVHQLSHGQKQRVALAGALVTQPRLLLLDEPSAGLLPPRGSGAWRPYWVAYRRPWSSPPTISTSPRACARDSSCSTRGGSFSTLRRRMRSPGGGGCSGRRIEHARGQQGSSRSAAGILGVRVDGRRRRAVARDTHGDSRPHRDTLPR